MVVMLPQRTSLARELGQAAGRGLQQGSETGINQARLQQAFEKLKDIKQQDYGQQLAAILPTLLTTPGGAQAAPEILERLGAFSQNASIRQAIENKRQGLNGQGQPTGIPGQNTGTAQNPATQMQGGPGQQGQQPIDYKRPTPPVSGQTTFPEATAGPRPQPEMSQAQQENYALDLMEQSMMGGGKPIHYGEALAMAQKTNQGIRDSNNQIRTEKKERESAQAALTEGAIKRLANSGLIKEPEDQTVAEKLALQAPFAENENQRYEYVRTKMKQFDEAKRAIASELDLAGPITERFRKITGTYKDKEQVIKDIQPKLKFFREHGLYDEGKALMADELGFGNELANTAMFPFTSAQMKETDSFPKNPRASFVDPLGKQLRENQFPGEADAMKPEQFINFKDKLAGFLEKNPDINLATLRGKLNQDKRYDWHDIYKALDELVDERRFNPDLEQEKQMTTLRQPPAPGLIEYFKYLWKEKK